VNEQSESVEWRVCPENDHYEVSSDGRVRRCVRFRKDDLYKELKVQTTNHGYLAVGLYRNGKYKRYFVHSLVMSAFVGKREQGHCVNHIDYDKTNNKLHNLEYVTPSENTSHAYKCKDIRDTIAREFQRWNCRLSDEQVRQLRREYATGQYKQREIARKYGISYQHTSDIVNRSRRELVEDDAK
jgi:RecG-like helicase